MYTDTTLNKQSPLIDRLINKLALLFILLDNLFLPINVGFDFRLQYILYALFIVYYLSRYRQIKLSRTAFSNFIIVIVLLACVPIIRGFGLLDFIKQLLLILFNVSFAFLLLNAYNFNIKKLFSDYIDLVYYSAIIGAIQIISQIIGFRYGADYSYLGFEMQNFHMSNLKIQSWYQEPSFLAIAFIPVVFVCLSRLFNLTKMISQRKAIFIIFILILSQSTSGLIGLLFCALILIVNKYSVIRRLHILLPLLLFCALAAFAFYSVPQVKLRIDDSVKLFFKENVTGQDIDATNLSTYAFYSNFKVTLESIGQNTFFGSGLGTYESNYNKYINQVIPKSILREQYPLNKKDANSMFFRLTSELGLIGIVLTVIYVIRNRIKLDLKNQHQDEIDFWIINSGILVLILVRLLRQGHYTMLGFMLFILIYTYTKRQGRCSYTQSHSN